MPKMTRRQIKKEVMSALRDLSRDPSLGYLAITAKPETQIRDRVAWWFHRKYSMLVTAREYQITSKKTPRRRKRVDLTLLDAALDPVAVIEFKAMIVPDPLAKSNHHLMIDLESDLARLAKITHAPRYGVMLMVHIENIRRLIRRRLHNGVFKFAGKFRRWANDTNAYKKAIRSARRFFGRGKRRSIRPLTIGIGSAWGTEVKLACFVIER